MSSEVYQKKIVLEHQSSIHLRPETFLLLVKQLRGKAKDVQTIEIDLDGMKVKGDLKVIVNNFPSKRFVGHSQSLDLLKRAAIAGFHALHIPENLQLDLEFKTVVKNKKTELLGAYLNLD